MRRAALERYYLKKGDSLRRSQFFGFGELSEAQDTTLLTLRPCAQLTV